MKVRGFTPAQQAIRRASLPRPTLNADLPVLAARDEILAAIRQHPVVIISGETGSGKTTQLPQLCLWLERGISGVIGCTQPRRVAARSVAQRLAQELGCPLGDQVGYQVRFHDHVSERSLIKVMTEGILLAEISSDPELRRYDTLILDEVHERSLNMDFLLGYLKSLLPRRPDLKIVLTSATLDTERLSAHFGHAPLIEVSGRTWPVEIRWRPITADHLDDETDEDLETQALIHAVDELTQLPPEIFSYSSPVNVRFVAPPMPYASIIPITLKYSLCSHGNLLPSRKEYFNPPWGDGSFCPPMSQKPR
jgi:ATP-dependent helicase HrpA